MRTVVRMRTALVFLLGIARSQPPADDPYMIGAGLGGQAVCPVFITGVTHGSPAERAGLRGGDYLLAVSGARVTGLADAFDRLRAGKSPAVSLSLWRSGREFDTIVERERRSVDARGTPERGKEFQDVVYGNIGRNEIPDHVAVLKHLAATRTYIDLSRAGVFGASYGGYFAIRALLQAPEVFRAGVAVAPLSDLRQVSGSATIYFSGDAEKDKDALEFASNLRVAGNLKGHLLLIHGTSDVNAPVTATMQMIDAFIRAGKHYDLILVPDQDHIIGGQPGAYILQQQRKYLIEHLQP
jgi:dienelactone hydrolase